MAGKLGLFGGTFDPPHMGHLVLARSLAEAAGLDRVIVLPSRQPPHKLGRTISPADHRLRMVQLAVEGDRLF